MDVDLELEYSDPISDFLRSKLKEIKSENEQLEAALQYRREMVTKYRAEISQNNNEEMVNLGNFWKKIINDKYVFGLEVKNDSQFALSDVKVTLSWNLSSPLTYKFHLLSSHPSSLIQILKSIPHAQSSHVIIIFDIPLFTDCLSCTIFGSISFQRDRKTVTLKFPLSIQLSPQDVTDNSIIIHLYKVIDGNNSDLLALALCSEKREFVVMIPKPSSRLLETVLEIDCGFSRINGSSNRKLFLVNTICPMFDGALLEIEDEVDEAVTINVYCKNLEVTTALLHYLHRHIIGVVIVPKPLYQPDLNPSEITDLVRNSLLKEFDVLERNSNSDLKKLREKMADIEHETDILLARINKKPDN